MLMISERQREAIRFVELTKGTRKKGRETLMVVNDGDDGGGTLL